VNISLPGFSLVVLVGPSGVGKSTFARKHFRATEVLSSDAFRAMVSDDEGDQSASKDAFEVLHLVLDRRLARRRFSVVDATNLEQRARLNLLKIAVKHLCPAHAIVFDLDGTVCEQRNTLRRRVVEEEVIRGHCQVLSQQKDAIAAEGFASVHVVTTPEAMDALTIEREPPPFDRRSVGGPFDLVGDVHGCFDELCTLLGQLGWKVEQTPEGRFSVHHPEGRKLIFVGDLVDRGPKIVDVLRRCATPVHWAGPGAWSATTMTSVCATCAATPSASRKAWR
jgi:protein phosphatase